MKKIRLSELSKKLNLPVIQLADAIEKQYGVVGINPTMELEELHVQFLLEAFALEFDASPKMEPEWTSKETLADDVRPLFAERNLFCLRFDIKGQIRHYVVDKAKKKILGTPGENIYTSVVQSVNTETPMLTVNRYSDDSGYERGVIAVLEDGLFKECVPIGKEYAFIDGVDKGVARVNKLEGGQKVWGIINAIDGSILYALKYKTIFNFYNKGVSLVKAEDSDGKAITLALPKKGDICAAIKGLSFKNYRRFKEFPRLNLGKINLIVGPNNAGKSTMGKALMLAFANLKQMLAYKQTSAIPLFSFAPQRFPILAKENSAKALSYGSDVKEIEFVLQVGEWESVMIVNCYDLEPKVNVPIKQWKLCSEKMGISFDFNFAERTESFIRKDWAITMEHGDINGNAFWAIDLDSNYNGLLDYLISGFAARHRLLDSDSKADSYLTTEITGSLHDHIAGLPENVECINDNWVAKTILDPSDWGNKLAKVAQDYFEIQDNMPNEVKEYIEHYLNKEFSIGKGIKVRSIEHEALAIEIVNGNIISNLAEFGRGTIQMVYVLMSLAVIILKNSSTAQTMVVVEEPEQNMHPDWQSKLANVFSDAYRLQKSLSPLSQGLFFLIETHSEYLVRKSQIIVANNNAQGIDNPFNVLYIFAKKQEIKQMHYENTGGFTDLFGNGFFDVASDLDLEIMRKERLAKSDSSVFPKYPFLKQE